MQCLPLLVVLLHLRPIQPDDRQPPDQLHLYPSRSLQRQVVSGSRVYVVCGGHRPWTLSNLKRRGLQLVAADAINNGRADCVPPHLGWDERQSVVKEFAEDSDYDKDSDYDEDSDYDGFEVERSYAEEDSGQVSPHQKSLSGAEGEEGEARGCQGSGSTRLSLFLAVCGIIISLGAAVTTPLITCYFLRGLARDIEQHLREAALGTLENLIRRLISPPAGGRDHPESGGSGGGDGDQAGGGSGRDLRLAKPSAFLPAGDCSLD